MTRVKANYATSQQVNESITGLLSPPYKATLDSLWRWRKSICDKSIVCAFLMLTNSGLFFPVIKKNNKEKRYILGTLVCPLTVYFQLSSSSTILQLAKVLTAGNLEKPEHKGMTLGKVFCARFASKLALRAQRKIACSDKIRVYGEAIAR